MTELVFILDRSGSMAGLEADTIGGFNSMIARQKQEAGEALVSTVLMTSFGTWGLPQMVHKYYGIRDKREVSRGVIISTFFSPAAFATFFRSSSSSTGIQHTRYPFFLPF